MYREAERSENGTEMPRQEIEPPTEETHPGVSVQGSRLSKEFTRLGPASRDTDDESDTEKLRKIPPDDITVTIFCALPFESVAVKYCLDEELDCHPFTWARPQVGPVKAAQCAATVTQQFPNIRFALMVGIGAGIPSAKRDIRLGDIAVSIPRDDHPGVIQYDFGKYELNGSFILKGCLDKPPPILINADGALEELEIQHKSPLEKIISRVTKQPSFARPTSEDILFEADFHHVKGDNCITCKELGADKVINHPILTANEKLRRDILRWLITINYSPQQDRYIRTRYPGTGQWFLNSAEFQKWLGASNQTLVCQGFPGAGKTIMTSVVVEHLQSLFQQGSHSVAYVYCDFQKRAQQKAIDILVSVLKQLTTKLAIIPDGVRDLYSQHQHDNVLFCKTADISKAIVRVISGLKRAFIIVDALDECPDAKELVSQLLQIQSMTGANLFITLRPDKDMQKRLEQGIFTEIWATVQDLNTYIDQRASELGAVEADDAAFQRDIRAEMKRQITESVHGIFLLARFYIDSLADKTTRNEILRELKSLPKGPLTYDEAYGKTIKRIRTQPPPRLRLASQVLTLLACAERPLTIKELGDALAVRLGHSLLDKGDIPRGFIIVTVCMGLVIVEEDSGIIRLVHHTALEYLRDNTACLSSLVNPAIPDSVTVFDAHKNHAAWCDAHRYFGTICLSYLSMAVFGGGACHRKAEFTERLQSNPLFHYAAHNWGHHVRQSLVLCDEVMSFFREPLKVEASAQLLEKMLGSEGVWQGYTRQLTPLHLVAYFGIHSAVQLLCEAFADVRDSFGRTPLSLAAENGHEAVVRVLVARNDVDPDCRDVRGETPLSLATKKGHEGVVRALLEAGAEVDIEVNNHREWNCGGYNYHRCDTMTPLHLAAKGKHLTIVSLLLNWGAKVNKPSISHTTSRRNIMNPLSYCAGYNFKIRPSSNSYDVFEISSHTTISTALHFAYHQPMVKKLLEHGADATNKYSVIHNPMYRELRCPIGMGVFLCCFCCSRVWS
ncbi:unnamed protein product [Clonostachys rosea f. rosea IK726]|uniref:Uncharacterized protein n=1 Tax=Clonostachys rosea f. rosea IK726 TaxID=1349383 RepID=A0ACA9UR14_BIOOC|nr:unnamed protein product [Clonostachys rosea f. rosea IK726]